MAQIVNANAARESRSFQRRFESAGHISLAER
jgi:hypothetical protein